MDAVDRGLKVSAKRYRVASKSCRRENADPNADDLGAAPTGTVPTTTDTIVAADTGTTTATVDIPCCDQHECGTGFGSFGFGSFLDNTVSLGSVTANAATIPAIAAGAAAAAATDNRATAAGAASAAATERRVEAAARVALSTTNELHTGLGQILAAGAEEAGWAM